MLRTVSWTAFSSICDALNCVNSNPARFASRWHFSSRSTVSIFKSPSRGYSSKAYADINQRLYLQMVELRRAKKYRDIADLFEELKSRDIVPSVAVYNLVMSIFAKTSDSTSVLMLLEEMKKNKVKLTPGTYNNIMEALGRSKDFEAMLRVLRDAHKIYQDPDDINRDYDTVLNILANADRLDDMMKVYEESKREYATISEILFSSMMRCISRRDQTLRLMKYMKEEMVGRGVQPRKDFWKKEYKSILGLFDGVIKDQKGSK